MTRRAFAIALIIALHAPPAGAGEADDAKRYADCMELARRAPKHALGEAEQWLNVGGGDGAEHCAGVALMGMGKHKLAAERLEALANRSRSDPALKARILGQAAQAWLVFGDAKRADAALASAIEMSPDDPELRIDRAQALAAAKNYEEALRELNGALRLSPFHGDALVFKATALRFMDRLDEAKITVEMALDFHPSHPEGLLERGILKRIAGDSEGARKDWMWILRLEPDGAAADAARANLERLDVKGP